MELFRTSEGVTATGYPVKVHVVERDVVDLVRNFDELTLLSITHGVIKGARDSGSIDGAIADFELSELYRRWDVLCDSIVSISPYISFDIVASNTGDPGAILYVESDYEWATPLGIWQYGYRSSSGFPMTIPKGGSDTRTIKVFAGFPLGPFLGEVGRMMDSGEISGPSRIHSKDVLVKHWYNSYLHYKSGDTSYYASRPLAFPIQLAEERDRIWEIFDGSSGVVRIRFIDSSGSSYSSTHSVRVDRHANRGVNRGDIQIILDALFRDNMVRWAAGIRSLGISDTSVHNGITRAVNRQTLTLGTRAADRLVSIYESDSSGRYAKSN